VSLAWRMFCVNISRTCVEKDYQNSYINRYVSRSLCSLEFVHFCAWELYHLCKKLVMMPMDKVSPHKYG